MCLVDGSTNKKVQRTCSHEISFFDQLRPGLLGKVGDDTFLHTCTERMPSRSFPCLQFHNPGETFHDLRLVEQSTVQSSTGDKRLREKWCARLPARLQHRANGGRDWTCSMVPASGSLIKMGAFFPQTLRILRLVSTLKPLHIVIHSLTCSTLVAVYGTRFSPKNMRQWK